MSDSEIDAGPPDARPRVSTNDDAPTAWRVTFEYDATGVRLLSQQRVSMITAPDDSDLTFAARTGSWVELRDAKGHGMYRQILHDPLRFDYEAFSPHEGVTPRRVDAPERSGSFQAVVPALSGATRVVLWGQPIGSTGSPQVAVELVSARLGTNPRRRDPK